MVEFFESIGNFFNDIFTNLLNFLWDLLFMLLNLLFGWINIPAFPAEFKNSIDGFLDLIFNFTGLLGFFVRPFTLRLLFPMILIVFNFKYIYRIVIWIVKKIPFLSMK